VELVTTADDARAALLAQSLESLNRQRQEAERALVAELSPLLSDSDPETPLVLGSDRWRTGLLGLVAGRLARSLHRPVALVSSAAGEPTKGSLRSVEGFPAKDALADCAELLDGFGGHAMAAGFRVRS